MTLGATPIDLEAIYSALYQFLADLAASTNVPTVSRILQHWSDVPGSQQPAFFLTETSMDVAYEGRGMPPVWHLGAKLYVYARTDGGKVPATVLNTYLFALQTALAPAPAENVLTLGGLVSYCRIEGTIETDEGTLGEQCVAIIPISMLVS